MRKSRIRWDKNASAAENARAQLPGLVRAYFEEGRAVTSGDPEPAALHRFRLRTKRLRYTLELFRLCYGEALEKYLAALRQVQQHLGDINDCAASREVIARAMPARSPFRETAEKHLDERTAALTAGFLDYWRSEFDAPGQEARWRAYLGKR